MQANAGISSLASSQYSASLHPTPTPVPFPGDVEMHDVSAATSTDGSPLNDPVSTFPEFTRTQLTLDFLPLSPTNASTQSSRPQQSHSLLLPP